VSRRRQPTTRAAEQRAQRERELGLDPADEAAQWLQEHDVRAPPSPPKRATKSKLLHQWRRRQRQGE
jgi:hypothetical protein